MMGFKSYFYAGFLVAFLAGCSYAVEKSHQDIQFITPGAENAECDVYIDKLRYQVEPPQTINVMKSDTDMKISCIAPGNRMQEAVVEPNFSSRTMWGTPAGMAWDYASSSMFDYPSVIAIDFSQEINKPFPLPRHNAPDVVQPEDYDLEEYLPGEPRLNSDRMKVMEPIRRKDDTQPVLDAPIDTPKPVVPDKGNLQSSNMIPLPEGPALEDQVQNKSSVVPPMSVEGKPTKLYPGE